MLKRAIKSNKGNVRGGQSVTPHYQDPYSGEDSSAEEITNSYVQWTTSDGNVFVPASSTKDILTPGVYEVHASPQVGIFFKKIPVRTEGLLRFPQTNSNKVIDEIKKFWEREEVFRAYDLSYKRGILLYGPPGSGKSCTIQLLMQDVVRRTGVVLLFQDPNLYIEGLRILRQIQPDTPVVTIMEDIDSLLDMYNESEILNILDGVNEADKVVFLATTNYPERLGARIVNRPSRFDKRFRIGYPNEESRQMYFEHLIGKEHIEELGIDLNRWVEDTDRLSLAHLKELFVAVVILDDEYDEAIKVLQSMKEDIDDRERFEMRERDIFLKLCVKGLEQKGLVKDERYKERFKRELKEIDAQAEHEYFVRLHLKFKEEGLMFPRNEWNSLVDYILGLAPDFDIEREGTYLQGEFPDIDIDYIKPVRDYLKREWAAEEFGQEYICEIGTYGTSGIKSSLLDNARVYSVGHDQIQPITSQMQDKDEEGDPLTWDTALEMYEDLRNFCNEHPEVADAAKTLLHRNRTGGVHAGGLIISSKPIGDFVPLEVRSVNKDNPSGVICSAWTEGLNAQDLQPVGLIKFDLLVISNLMQIALACELVKQRHPEMRERGIAALPGSWDWSDISYLNDPKAIDMANQADLKCIFQFDSEGIRKLVKRGGVTGFDDLAAYSALYRPGPLNEGMDARYCKRKQKEEPWTLRPVLEPVLGRTYGVMVFQEQVQEILRVVGEIPDMHTEKVRKAISKKQVKVFGKYKDNFLKNGQRVLNANIGEVNDLWNQIEAFAAYGFNKSHAYAYTYISSRLLYLKAHFPTEFYTAILMCEDQADKMKEYKLDAHRHDVEVKPVHINKSQENFSICEDDVYFGFQNIKGLGEEVARRVVESQPYEHFHDFLDRFGTDSSAIKAFTALGIFEEDYDREMLRRFSEYYKDQARKRRDRQKRFEQSMDKKLVELREALLEHVTEDDPDFEVMCDYTDEARAKWEERFSEVMVEKEYKSKGEIKKKDVTFLSMLQTMDNRRQSSINNFHLKEKEDDESPITIDQFNPAVVKLDDKELEVLHDEMVIDGVVSYPKAESMYYGFQWSHVLETSPDYTGEDSTIDAFLERGEPVGTVQVLIKAVQKRTSKKGTEFYSIIIEDSNSKEMKVNVWLDDYLMFQEQWKKGNMVSLRVRPPSGGFNTMTFESMQSKSWSDMSEEELEITSENFAQYFFDVRRHKPEQGQIMAKFSAVALFGPGQPKKDMIQLMLMDKAYQAAAVMEKIHCARVPDCYRVPREIAEDLLSGMSVEEVENKDYEFVLEACYYTQKEYVPKDDPHWETLQLLQFDPDSGAMNNQFDHDYRTDLDDWQAMWDQMEREGPDYLNTEPAWVKEDAFKQIEELKGEMKNWVLAFILALAALAPIGYFVYHNTPQDRPPVHNDSYPMVQFETQKMAAMEPDTKHNVLACKVVDGYRFLMFLENEEHIEAHLPVATKPEAVGVVVELLNKTSSPPPTVKLLRKVDNRYWIVEFTITIEGESKDLVEYLRGKDAIGSMMGMKWLLRKQYGLSSVLYYDGEVAHPQNVSMDNLLEPGLLKAEDSYNPELHQIHILVDTIPANAGVGGHDVNFDVVIDHHRDLPSKYDGILIHRKCGSCAGIVYDLIKKLVDKDNWFDDETDGDQKVATAMIAGIVTDCMFLMADDTTEIERHAFNELFEYRNSSALHQIVFFKRPRLWIDKKAAGCSDADVDGEGYAIVGLGIIPTSQRDLIADMAEEMNSWATVETAIAFGVVGGDRIEGCVRSLNASVNVPELCKKLAGKCGSGGGKHGKGAYRIGLSPAFDPDEEEEDLLAAWDSLKKREIKRIQMSNSITLFSNGIGHFSRAYDVGGEKKISIPFKKEHIGDVAASLQVFGKVKLSSPPSFTPSNSDSTHLCIDQKNAMRSLLESLSGASVSLELSSSTKYTANTLLGVESEEHVTGGEKFKRDVLIVMSGSQLRRIPFSDVKNFEFVEEAVRAEIGKALKKNFQQIKPDSTFLDLVLEAREEGDTQATVQYTIPVAAWKMRYAIREEDGKFFLEGAAVIDNNTDEDWVESTISVVTGNPISFNTDIATVVTPKRKTINLVESQVLGNVAVAEGMVMPCSAGGFESASRGGARAMRAAAGAKMSMSNYADFGMEEGLEACAAPSAADMAEHAGVDTKEVGDFSIFTSKQPVTILARKSAVVPMFNITLTKAGAVLYYKESNHGRRPYRSVKFKNEADYTLNRGKTTIYNDGVFSGECVLETTKPNDNRTLPHCLENGVKIVKEPKGSNTAVSSIRISEGVIVQEQISVARTDYLVVNKKDEEFKLHLEHQNMLHGPNNQVSFEGVEIQETEKVHDTGGYRAYFTLKPNEKVTLTVIETMAQTSQWNVGGRYNWIQTNIIGQGLNIATDKSIQAAADVQKQIDDVQRQVNEAHERESDLTDQAERVRENLSAAKDVANNDMVAEWVRDLDTTEKEIRTINKVTVPDLQRKQRELQQTLAEKLQAISVSWKTEEPPKVPVG
ncbi:dnaE [Symbiodinium microadriaticum]|nr:dnaE [Symbiodinium microadriaticum]